jgi:hypothetical protein
MISNINPATTADRSHGWDHSSGCLNYIGSIATECCIWGTVFTVQSSKERIAAVAIPFIASDQKRRN